MTETPLQVGLIGYGNIGRQHLRSLLKIPAVRISGISDLNAVSEKQSDGTAIPYFPNWQDIVDDANTSALVISLPHNQHAICASAAVESGKPVFLEKPIAAFLEEALALRDLAATKKILVMVNMTHRFYPTLRKARELIRAGAIGEVISVRDFYIECINRKEFPSWYFDPVVSGGGVAITDAIHLLDRISWLLNQDLKFVSGCASKSISGVEVESCVEMLCTTRAGTPVSVGSLFCEGPKFWDDGLLIIGTAGVLKIKAWSHVELQTYGSEPVSFSCYDSETPTSERGAVGQMAALRNFVDACHHTQECEAEITSVLNAHRVIDAFYHSKNDFGIPSNEK